MTPPPARPPLDCTIEVLNSVEQKLAVFDQVVRSFGFDSVTRRHYEVMCRVDYCSFVVAKHNGVYVGMIAYVNDQTLPYTYVVLLGTTDSFRKRGVATKLWSFMVDDKSRNGKPIHIHSDPVQSAKYRAVNTPHPGETSPIRSLTKVDALNRVRHEWNRVRDGLGQDAIDIVKYSADHHFRWICKYDETVVRRDRRRGLMVCTEIDASALMIAWCSRTHKCVGYAGITTMTDESKMRISPLYANSYGIALRLLEGLLTQSTLPDYKTVSFRVYDEADSAKLLGLWADEAGKDTSKPDYKLLRSCSQPFNQPTVDFSKIYAVFGRGYFPDV